MSDNTLKYVVHSGFVYEADEWYNSYDGQRYDDVLEPFILDYHHKKIDKPDWIVG